MLTRLKCLFYGHADKVEKALLLPHNLKFNGEWLEASSVQLRCSHCKRIRFMLTPGNWAQAMRTRSEVHELEKLFHEGKATHIPDWNYQRFHL